MGIWLWRVDKTYRFLVTLGCALSRKYDELSKSVASGQELKYFTHHNGAKGGPHENEF